MGVKGNGFGGWLLNLLESPQKHTRETEGKPAPHGHVCRAPGEPRHRNRWSGWGQADTRRGGGGGKGGGKHTGFWRAGEGGRHLHSRPSGVTGLVEQWGHGVMGLVGSWGQEGLWDHKVGKAEGATHPTWWHQGESRPIWLGLRGQACSPSKQTEQRPY